MWPKILRVCVCVCVLLGGSRKAILNNTNLQYVNKSAEDIQIEDRHQEELPNSKPN